MHADRRVAARVGRREVEGPAARLQTGAHRDDVVHPLLDGALHHPLAVRVERLVDEMGVGVHQHGQAVRVGQIGDDDLGLGFFPPPVPPAVLGPASVARAAVIGTRGSALPVLRARGGFGFPGGILPFYLFGALPAPSSAPASAAMRASFSFRTRQ